MTNYINEIKEVANSEDCSKEKVDTIKNNFEKTEHNNSDIKTEYEKSSQKY